MIHCKWCKIDKAESDFYKSDIRKGGYGKCKDCVCGAVQKNRKANIEYYQEYERGRANLRHRVKARKDYAKTDNGKEARFRGTKKYRKKNPSIHKAHNLVNNGIRDGVLIKPNNCESCNGDSRIHGHHCDYNKPLDVMWLCESCHLAWHRENTPIYCNQ